MFIIPVRRGNKILGACYIIIFLLVVWAYIVSPSSQANSSSVYLLGISQFVFSLGLYCLLPKELDRRIDVGAFWFAFIPFLVLLVSSFIANTLISVSFGVLASISFYLLMKKRIKEFHEHFRKLANLEE